MAPSPAAGRFPVLFLFAANIREQISTEPMLAPLALSIGAAGALLVLTTAIAWWLGADPARGALVVSLAVALFFAYGHVWPVVEPTLHVHRYLLLVWSALGLAGVAFAARARRERVDSATGAVTLAGLVLVALNAVPIVQFQLASTAPVGNDAVAGASADPSAPSIGQQRDIWYLVFDRYAGQDSLSRLYGFDNTPFLGELQARGFAVAEHATANYLKTAHSIASTLSMDYLDTDALARAAAASDDWAPLYRALQDSYPVERELHERGYEYLHLGVRRGATYTNAAADRVFLYDDQTEFSTTLADTTLLVALENVLSTDEDEAPGGSAGVYGRQTRYQLRTLDELARVGTDRPRFIFAHLLLPHPPYVFNADGSWVTPRQAAARNADQAYLAQLEYANQRILQLLDRLLDRPAEEQPVILIQADEGPFPPRYAQDEEAFAWTEATDDELLRKFSILAAYRVPGVEPDELGVTPTTTPVNSFRLIFNAVFRAELPILPDRNLVFVDQRHLYQMVDLTDRVRTVVEESAP